MLNLYDCAIRPGCRKDIMGFLQNNRERRCRERRRRCRTGTQFPLTDGRGCIVPFERSRIADRRCSGAAPPGGDALRETDHPVTGCRHAVSAGGRYPAPRGPAAGRDFHIAGKLIARVDNFNSSPPGGRWKELELYQTKGGQYVCLEIWRTSHDGQYDQYWLATCDDLRTARDFFGNNRLVSELFERASTLV